MKLLGCSLVLAAAAASCEAFVPAPVVPRAGSNSRMSSGLSSSSARDALATRRPSVRLPTPPEVLEQAPQQPSVQDEAQQQQALAAMAVDAAAAADVEAAARPKKGKGPQPVVVLDDDMLETTAEHR